jgi:hypothetical protein
VGIQDGIIKSTAYSQTEILQSIIKLYCHNGFYLDPTYSKGNFYKDKTIPEPTLKMDINPQFPDVIKADCRYLPLKSNSVPSLIFDPPFVVGPISSPGIMRDRFSCFKNTKALWEFYDWSLDEFHRVVHKGGFVVVKCQDMVSGGKQYLSHVAMINSAVLRGFIVEDLFVLLATNRVISPNTLKQQHARKYHSYVLVLYRKI